MVAPTFGFSVGDFVAGTKLIVSVCGAFKEAGGASSKYSAEVSFLGSLTATLRQLEEYTAATADSSIAQDIANLVQLINGPLGDFSTFLDKYKASLDTSSTKSKLMRVPKTISYTVKDIAGKVDKLRRQVEQPLQAINSLLSLQTMCVWPIYDGT
jgi:hypothetical protein